MTKQLIVVVHGVGVKEAGISSDMLAVSLADINLKPESSDDFNLAEDDLYNVSDKRQIYPCRVRQYAGQKRRRIIADFYWGDIANSRKGVWGIWPSFFKTIMGLGHIIRENSHEVYKDSPAGQWITSVIVKVLHGPIVAINLVMLLGVLIALGLEAATGNFGGGEFSPWVIGAVAIGAGLVLRARARAYLERLLWCWVIVTGFVVIAMQIVQHAIPVSLLDFLMPIKAGIQTLICAEGEGYDKCLNAISGIYLDGILLLIFVQALSLLNMVLLFVLAALIPKSKNQQSGLSVPSIVFPTVMVMTVMWLFLIACIWILAITPWWQLIPHDNIQEFGLRILVVVVPVLLLLFSASLVVWFNRAAWAHGLKQQWKGVKYFNDEARNTQKHRLVVNNSVYYIIYPAFAFFTFLSVYILFGLSKSELLEEYVFFDYYSYVFDFVMVSAVAITVFAYMVRNGLDVATDIITYLNDYSWESRRTGTAATKVFLENWLNLKIPPEEKSGYFHRNRIKKRLEMLVDRLIKHEAPDELYIVAHSQGTVIAMDVIEEYGLNWRKTLKPNAKFGLITMGSPYTHIHNHYFPSSFPAVQNRKALHKREDGGLLDKWINIFRVDDYVGTHIHLPDSEYDDEQAWPVERPVEPNGHTEYWVDVNVAEVLRDELRING